MQAVGLSTIALPSHPTPHTHTQRYPGGGVGPEHDSKMGGGHTGYEPGHKPPFSPQDTEAGGAWGPG